MNLTDTSLTFIPAGESTTATIPLQPKAIIGDFEMEYGRLTALLGTEIRQTPSNIESRVPSGYIDPPTEVLKNSINVTPIGSMSDGTQIWRITNNDVDLHPVHWHMVNLQVINRVIWDETVVPPEPSETGWRETINTPPLTDTIVALRPITPDLPSELPNSIRPLDVTQEIGETNRFTGLDPTGNQAPVTNHLVNFGWEYVWHCHILGHEENDFMHPMAVAVAPRVPPSDLTAAFVGPKNNQKVELTWEDNSVSETDWTIQRSCASGGPHTYSATSGAQTGCAGPWTDIDMIPSETGPQTGDTVSYIDPTVSPNSAYFYRVLATNIVGDTTQYSWTSGYPYIIVNSPPSDEILTPVQGKNVKHKTGVYRPGAGFYLKKDYGSTWAESTDDHLGWDDAANDLPIAGDWNGDGQTETGVYRPGAGFYFKMDNGSTWAESTDDHHGWDDAANDLPIAGDWNGDGQTETGVYRPGAGFYLKMDNGSTWTPSTDVYLAWDNAPNDLPIAGDWNGDGQTETGVYRPGAGFYLKMDNGSTWTPSTDVYLAWDNAPNDLPIAGDWNGDGQTETGVYRPGAGFYLKMDNGSTWTPSTDVYLAWDNANGDLPVAGNFV